MLMSDAAAITVARDFIVNFDGSYLNFEKE